MYYADVQVAPALLETYLGAALRGALPTLRARLADVVWSKADIAAAVKATLAEHGLKMGQLVPAVRVLVCGREQTPSLDAVLELFTREQVLSRLGAAELQI
jgi:glutamyl-tRNA synthetase